MPGKARQRFLPIASVLLCLLCAAAYARSHPGAPAPDEIAGVVQREVQHDGSTWDVFELDLSKVDLQLYGQADPTLRTFAGARDWLASRAAHWEVMTNGGMFHPGQRPVGLHIEAGKQYAPLELADGEGNFFVKPNGVFYLDAAGAHVVASESYAPHGAVRLATQSGPLLLQHGALHPRFNPRSTSTAKRSGVGVRDPSHVAIAVSRAGVTFHSAATLFRDALHCPDALYLDGTISDFDTPARRGASARTFGSVLVAVAR